MLRPPRFLCEFEATRNGAVVAEASIGVQSADEAVRWLRICVETALHALEGKALSRATDFLATLHESERALEAGKSVNLSMAQEGLSMGWTASPITAEKRTGRPTWT
ncbi:hypothetical protein ABT160_14710 [Streptomyces sp. NPDC001941]|uniref:hypothetical protein n=1 Tax=Streptomyces sp. NPDC001941 TaxID=3154659 RepID=UPI00332CF33D